MGVARSKGTREVAGGTGGVQVNGQAGRGHGAGAGRRDSFPDLQHLLQAGYVRAAREVKEQSGQVSVRGPCPKGRVQDLWRGGPAPVLGRGPEGAEGAATCHTSVAPSSSGPHFPYLWSGRAGK